MKNRDAHAALLAGFDPASSSGDGGRARENGWQPGQLARSTAGRDKGRYYLVLAVHDREVLLSDGRRRPRKLPKVKNIRHLQRTRRVAADLAALLRQGGPTDEQIRAVIAEMLGDKEEEG